MVAVRVEPTRGDPGGIVTNIITTCLGRWVGHEGNGGSGASAVPWPSDPGSDGEEFNHQPWLLLGCPAQKGEYRTSTR